MLYMKPEALGDMLLMTQNKSWECVVPTGNHLLSNIDQSRSQSLRSPWSAVGKRDTMGVTDVCPISFPDLLPLDQRSKTRALGLSISGMRHRYHRCRLRTAQWNRMCRIRLFPLLLENGCSQSSRSPTAGQGERSSRNEIDVCPSGFTAQSVFMAHARNGCSQRSRFPTAGQRKRRLWERDCIYHLFLFSISRND